MSSTPLLSIGLFVYNGEPFIRRALDSLLAQTFRDFELIISDNASTDRTAQICLEYAGRDPRIRFFRAQKNMGAGWNCRRVYFLATGKYFKWAACDDICGRLDRLDAVIVQPSAEARSVALFRFHGGQLAGPAQLVIEAEEEAQDATMQTQQAQPLPAQSGEPEAAPLAAFSVGHAQSMEGRIRAALESLQLNGVHSAQKFAEELAILKRWYYRSHKVGEVFFADEHGELPWRRIVRGVGRVYRGEKDTPALESAENKPEAAQ